MERERGRGRRREFWRRSRRVLGSVLVVPMALVGVALATPPSSESSPSVELARGKLLVAARQLRARGFAQSVILLVEHGALGSLGLIVNRPSPIKLADVLPSRKDARERGDDLWLGGPVEPTRLMLLARTPEPLVDGIPVFDQVQLIVSLQGLERAFGMGIPPTAIRAYAGHAGWAPGQLAGEIARGDWLVMEPEVSTVFSTEPLRVWSELVEGTAGRWVRDQPPRAQAPT